MRHGAAINRHKHTVQEDSGKRFAALISNHLKLDVEWVSDRIPIVVWLSVKVRNRESVSLCRPVFMFGIVVDPI